MAIEDPDKPPARASGPPHDTCQLSDQAFQAYLAEYAQCAESYRHTYATIWQASALFIALSAGMLAFRNTIPQVDFLAPLPVIFWFLGIFRPMNRYGELRNDRLAELESLLSARVSGLEMNHYRLYRASRRTRSPLRRAVSFAWLWRPRVVEVVSAFCTMLIILELYLVFKYIR